MTSSTTPPSATPKVILTMIVRNEARIIERCLESARPVIDGLCLCDTGSTDETIAVVKAYATRTDLPTAIHQQPWRNFGHNRTLSYQAAQAMADQQRWPRATTYALLLDADMVLVVPEPEVLRRQLTEPGYMVKQDSGDIYYNNIRLIRLDQPATCVGYTHEYWSVSFEPPTLTALWIDDRGDGGCKDDKYERDLKLLLASLADDQAGGSQCPRTHFYLGQTYWCLKRYQAAIRSYKRRIALGGWPEEVYYSAYQIANCYRALGDGLKFAGWCFKAYHLDPARAESLSTLAEYYVDQGRYRPAYHLAKLCLTTPVPDSSKLFVEPRRYRELPLYQLCICAYYLGYDDGLLNCERYARTYGQTWRLDNIIPYYLTSLKSRTLATLTSPLEGYAPKNPALYQWRGQLWVNLQLVNYTMDPLMRYSHPGHIETRNYQAVVDGERWSVEVRGPVVDPVDYDGLMIRGMEDARYITDDRASGQDRWALVVSWVEATIIDGSIVGSCRSLGRPAIHLITLDDQGTVVERHQLHAPGDREDRAEKNWLPLERTDDHLDVWYSAAPMTVLRVELVDGQAPTTRVYRQYQLTGDYSELRGSAALRLPDDYQPRPDGAAYLLLTHELYHRHLIYQGVEGTPRSYYHRFLWLDRDFRPVRLSLPFYFKEHGVEYLTSLVYHRGHLLTILTLNDHDAWLIELDPTEVMERSVLEPEINEPAGQR